MPVFDEKSLKRQALGENKESQVETRTRNLTSHVSSNILTVADDCGRDTSSLIAQMGRHMTSQELMRRLKLCNPRLHFERSIRYPELFGIYVRVDDKLVHVCGMEAGINPEFSVRHKKKMRVPDNDLFGTTTPVGEVKWKEIETFDDETRGWRTVLLRLLEAKLITRGDVMSHFDWLPSQESQYWMPNDR